MARWHLDWGQWIRQKTYINLVWCFYENTWTSPGSVPGLKDSYMYHAYVCELFLHLTCIPYLKIVKFVCFFVKCRRNVLQWLAKPKIHVLGLVAEKRPGTRHRTLPKSRVWFCLARGVPKNFHHLLRETRKFRDLAQLDVVVVWVSLCADFFLCWSNIFRKNISTI